MELAQDQRDALARVHRNYRWTGRIVWSSLVVVVVLGVVSWTTEDAHPTLSYITGGALIALVLIELAVNQTLLSRTCRKVTQAFPEEEPAPEEAPALS